MSKHLLREATYFGNWRRKWPHQTCPIPREHQGGPRILQTSTNLWRWRKTTRKPSRKLLCVSTMPQTTSLRAQTLQRRGTGPPALRATNPWSASEAHFEKPAWCTASCSTTCSWSVCGLASADDVNRTCGEKLRSTFWTMRETRHRNVARSTVTTQPRARSQEVARVVHLG